MAKAFEAEQRARRNLSRDAAIDLAIGRPSPSGDPSERGRRFAGKGLLGARQAKVATLVAEGLTNKEIAARLMISERTVDSHVRGILNKLGFNSRVQIAAWAGAPRSA